MSRRYVVRPGTQPLAYDLQPAYEEKFTVEIARDALLGAPASGYQLKVFARDGGDATITVPKGTVERLLAALEKQGPQNASPTN